MLNENHSLTRFAGFRLDRSERTINIQAEHIRSISEEEAVGPTARIDGPGTIPGSATGPLPPPPPPPPKDPYAVLGLPYDFTPADLKRLYREASRRAHPDRGGDTDEFQQVAAAHRLLSDPGLRGRFNRGDDLPKVGHKSTNGLVGHRLCNR